MIRISTSSVPTKSEAKSISDVEIGESIDKPEAEWLLAYNSTGSYFSILSNAFFNTETHTPLLGWVKDGIDVIERLFSSRIEGSNLKGMVASCTISEKLTEIQTNEDSDAESGELNEEKIVPKDQDNPSEKGRVDASGRKVKGRGLVKFLKSEDKSNTTRKYTSRKEDPYDKRSHGYRYESDRYRDRKRDYDYGRIRVTKRTPSSREDHRSYRTNPTPYLQESESKKQKTKESEKYPTRTAVQYSKEEIAHLSGHHIVQTYPNEDSEDST